MDATELQRLTVACRLMGKSLVDELEKVESKHYAAFIRAKDAYRDRREKAIREATEKIDAMLKDEAEEVESLRRICNQAELDLHDAKFAEATKQGCMIGDVKCPVGTKVKRTSGTRYRGDKTEYGILEVYKAGTRISDKTARWKTPRLGEIFVRILKKDGTPGMRISDSYGWTVVE